MAAKAGKFIWLEFTPVDPLADLRELAIRFPALAERAFRRRALKMRPRYLAMFAVEPPPHTGGIDWTSDLQQVAFFASDGFGGGIPTVRDHSYVNAFELKPVTKNFEGLFVLTNDDEGAPYIGGELQQQFHRDTGWINIADKAAEVSPQMADELQDEYFLLADPVAALQSGGFP